MKNVTFTYDTISTENGIQISGEACVSVLLDDKFADEYKAAIETPEKLTKGQAFDDLDKVEGFLKACEKIRGRNYVYDSIKCVEINEV